MNDFIFIYITNPNKEEAKKIAKHLIEKKLIACANIYDNITSIYFWEGKIADENECVLIAKTLDKNFEKVKTEDLKSEDIKSKCFLLNLFFYPFKIFLIRTYWNLNNTMNFISVYFLNFCFNFLKI